MREEYKVEMFRHGKWVIGSIPFVGHIQITEDLEAARATVAKAKDAWSKFSSPHYDPAVDRPTDWRIMSRKVSAWSVRFWGWI